MPAARTIIANSIANDLGAAIVSGLHRAGAAVPGEEILCVRFGASRTAVREAVKMLLAKGLLAVRPRLGTRVRPEADWNILDPDVLRWMLARDFSLPLLLEFTELRLAAEPAAAALAAARAGQEDRMMLQQSIDAMFAADRDEGAFLAADIAFHVAILTASHNRFYIGLRPMIETALRFSIRQTREPAGMVTTATEHASIARAILAGEAAAAAAAMQTLIQDARAKIVARMSPAAGST